MSERATAAPTTTTTVTPTTTTSNSVGDTTPPSVKKANHEGRPRNRIQVSREKRPLSFFLSLAKKFLANEDEVELSGLGLAVTTVVTVAEILKNSGHVEITKISTSLVDMKDEQGGGYPARTNGLPKAKIQIWIKKSDQFQELMAEEDANKGGSFRRSSSRGKQSAPTTAVVDSKDDAPSPAEA